MMPQQYFWDDRLGRYRDARGHFVSEAVIRGGVDNVIAQAQQDMRAVAQKFRTDDAFTVADFQREMMRLIKLTHVTSALAVYGGKQHMTPSTWGRVGQIIRVQYQYVTKMSQDILDGRQRLNGRLDVRAMQYANAARATYENLRRIQQPEYGRVFERNVLHAKESCVGCVSATGRGWEPIGSLPPIGARECRGNCRCTMQYRDVLPSSVRDVLEVTPADLTAISA